MARRGAPWRVAIPPQPEGTRSPCHIFMNERHRSTLLKSLAVLALCFLLAGCNLNINVPGGSGGTGGQCQSNCTAGSGVQGVSVIVEPDAGPTPLVDAIQGAHKSIDLEMYLLTNTIHYFTQHY